MTKQNLNTLRKEIDAIDDQLIDLIKQRIGVVDQVGILKRGQDKNETYIRPGREATMLRRIYKEFADSQFPSHAACAIWRLLIGASTQHESGMTISTYESKETPHLFWLAQEYFGGFIPVTIHANDRLAMSDVMEKKAMVAVLPTPDVDTPGEWWIHLAEQYDERPKIVAHIPFIMNGKTPPAAMLLGYIEPEETGDDITLLALETEQAISRHLMLGLGEKAKIEIAGIHIAEDQPGNNHYLLELKGFFMGKDEDIAKMISSLGSNLVRHAVLGAYATPITVEET